MSFFNIVGKLFGNTLLFNRHYVTPQTESKIQRDWQNIEVLLRLKGPTQLQQALVIADKTLGAALKDIADGETLGERLKNARGRFDRETYNKVWEAHKVRNNMVHETGYEPPHYVVEQAISQIKSGLKELKVNI
jgi:hypothetical protein